jgi:ketosteroid isomerase-like protein
MSEDNIALVRSLYEAFGRGDVDTVLGGFADDIEWVEPDGLPYDTQHSPQGVAEGVFARVTSDVEGFSVNPEEYYAGGDEVVALGRYGGKGSSTGKPFDLPFAHVWKVRDGKIARFREYSDTVTFNSVIGAEVSV